MGLLNEFIHLELNAYTKGKILEAIEKAKNSGGGNIELTFNIYSIVINPSANEAILSNDVVYEIPEETIHLEEFRGAISRFQPK